MTLRRNFLRFSEQPRADRKPGRGGEELEMLGLGLRQACCDL